MFSLQAVNPKLAVLYWDNTIETTDSTNLAYDPNLPYTRTELLSPTWFETADIDDLQDIGLRLLLLDDVSFCR